jgi:chloramphenicol-sensitive protein RarD
LLPLYLSLLEHVPAAQILAHRVLWSAVLLVIVALLFRRLPIIIAAVTRRTLLLLAATALLIGANWLVYIWAVQNGHVLDASLGYFINPLVNVVLGVVVLGERVRRIQGAAIALAIDALGGLLIETLLLAPIALVLVVMAQADGTGVFGHRGVGTDVLLVIVGALTAAPLLLFAAAARRMPYTALGLLQYIAPTLQFLLAILVFGEHLRPHDLAAFALIWAGLAVYAIDVVRAARA